MEVNHDGNIEMEIYDYFIQDNLDFKLYPNQTNSQMHRNFKNYTFDHDQVKDSIRWCV